MPRSRTFLWVGSLALAVGLLSGCGDAGGGSTTTPPPAPAPVTASTPPDTSSTTSTATPETPAKDTAAAKPVTVVIETSKGAITAELDSARAPITVKNFLNYVRKGFYSGTIFHRVISDFMIQGGGFTADMKEKDTDAPIVNEGGNGLKNDRGTLAMARTSDPNSATAQFFISVKDNESLNRDTSMDGYGYAVFGKVTKGMDVVDKIKDVKTDTAMTPQGPMQDVPETPVVIKSITIKE
jgi:cyclophilin family peptidyl-prolyl cis-trans isomerase